MRAITATLLPLLQSIRGPLLQKNLIHGKWTDFLFLYGAPWIALCAGAFFYLFTPLGSRRVIPQYFLTWDQALVTLMNHAHLVLVFSRSHLNRAIFPLHPLRFTLVPILVLLGMCSSTWIFTTMVVLGLLWGEYHSSIQTFGIARIYEVKAGGDRWKGRTKDFWFANVIYFVPLLAGPNLLRAVSPFEQFKGLDPIYLPRVPAIVLEQAHWLRPVALWVGLAYTAYYLIDCWKHKHFSAPKWALWISTATASVVAWGTLPLAQAVFVMHFFHCTQYFALVWHTERISLSERLNRIQPSTLLFLVILAITTYAVFAMVAKAHTEYRFPIALVTLVSLCHLWYDGFIWSVRKKQV